MKMHLLPVSTAFTVFGLTIFSSVTQAYPFPFPQTPYFYSNSEVCSTTNTCITNVQQTDGTGAPAQSNLTRNWQSTSELNGNTITSTISASSRGEASYGQLKAYGSGSLTDVRIGTYSPGSPAFFGLQTADEITASASGFTTFNWSLVGNIISNPLFSNPAYEMASIDFSVNAFTITQDPSGVPIYDDLYRNSWEAASGSTNIPISATIQHTANQPFYLEVTLGGSFWFQDTRIFPDGTSFPDPYSYSGEIDFSSTVTYLGATVTDEAGNPLPNAVITSASGFDYSSVVPVPAAAWLFGSALLGLVGVARRKKTD